MIQVDRRFGVLFGAGLLAFAVLMPRAAAQAVAVAQVEGQVLDETGALVPNAEVKMTETEKGISHTALADSSGHYIVPNLPAGPYTLEASAPGFKGYVQPRIVLQVGQNIQINVTLQLGAVSEHVEVTGNVGMVETKDNTISSVMDGARVLDLPLNGRQATDLILLGRRRRDAPGRRPDGQQELLQLDDHLDRRRTVERHELHAGRRGAHRHVHQRQSAFPFPRRLAGVQRRNQHAAGAEWDASGWRRQRGDEIRIEPILSWRPVRVYPQWRRECAKLSSPPTHDSLKRNQYGGTLGGKIIKDKLFFFGGFQGTRNRQDPPQTISYVPTPATLAGDFSVFDGARLHIERKCKAADRSRGRRRAFSKQPDSGDPFQPGIAEVGRVPA